MKAPSEQQYNAAKKWLRWDNYLSTHLDNPKVIIDVGANIGYSSIFFARNYPDAIVYAIEPVQENFDYLVQNIEDYPNIIAYQFALGQSMGELILSLANPDDKNLGTMSFQGVGWRSETVPMFPLDSRDWGKVDFIKIDVEGYEPKVLKGAEATLTKHWPLIQMEVNDEAEEYLFSIGYKYITRRSGDNFYVKSGA